MPLSQSDLDHILNKTKPLWQSIRNNRFFITGGTGFFGKWLLESFVHINRKLSLNCQMLVLTRSPEKFIQRYPHFGQFNEIAFLKADVQNFKFPDEKFDYIIHAAATEASVTLNAAEPFRITDTITEGTKKTLDFAKQCEAKRFLFVSSGAVYGKQPDNLPLIPESYNGAPDSLNPLSAYGQGKRTAEMFCSIYNKCYGIETSIARCFVFVGPYLSLNHYAIGNFIRDVIKGGPIIVNGDGSPLRSYLYAADLAIWLWTILFNGRAGRAYNVGSDQQISIGQLADKVSKCFKKHPEVIISQKPVLENPTERYVPCTKLAREELSLDCWIKLDDAIKRTVEFHENCK